MGTSVTRPIKFQRNKKKHHLILSNLHEEPQHCLSNIEPSLKDS